MKNIYKTIAILIYLAATSCSLDEEPFTFYAPENFYANKSDAVAAMMSVYDSHQDNMINYFYLSEVPTSEVIVSGVAETVMDEYDWEPGSNSFYAVWEKSYIGINRANTVIDRVPGISDLEQSTVDALVAEARFLRALFYFDLVRFFGHVPILDKETTSLDNVYPTNENTTTEVWQLILDDLTYAETNLPATRPDTEKGRATKYAATGYLAKVYLQRSGLAKYNSDPENWGVEGVNEWALALEKAQKVIDEGGYELLDNFADVFNVEFNNERLFEIQYTTGVGEGQNLSQNTLPNGILPGAMWGISRLTPEFLAEWDTTDNRFDKTFLLEYTSVINGEQYSYPEDLEHPYSAKYLYPDGLSGDFGINITLLRYAEILLIHSEAAQGAGTGDPYFGVNMVRERADLSPLSGLSQEELKEAIRKERRHELNFEFNSFTDMQRWGTLEMEATKSGYPGIAEPRHYLYPIPAREMDTNPNLKQNFGY